jgi:hypothetical protein
MDSKGASLTTQCLAFCQALASQGQAFSFALTIGPAFSFSLDNREKMTINKVKMNKKPSPSTVIRNQKRREEFLKGNVKNAEPVKHFQCDQCEQIFTTKKVLKVHTWKTHKIESENKSKEKDYLKEKAELESKIKELTIENLDLKQQVTILDEKGDELEEFLADKDKEIDELKILSKRLGYTLKTMKEKADLLQVRKGPGGGPIHR